MLMDSVTMGIAVASELRHEITCVSGPSLRMAYLSSIMGDAYTVRCADNMLLL